MKPEISVQDLLFGVDQVPVEAVIGTDENRRRIAISGKKISIKPDSRRRLCV